MESNVRTNRLQGSLIVLHGPNKVGKTQLASHFPAPVCFIATEPGHKFIPAEQKKLLINLEPDTGWDTFLAALKDGLPKVSTLVVDTVAGLYDLCFQGTCKENNWGHPSDAPHGKGWNAIKLAFLDALNRLAWQANKMNATLILIDHSKEETIETATSNVEKVVCAMPGQARNIVLAIPDFIWFLGYNEATPQDSLSSTTAERKLWVTGTQLIEAGCRDPQVVRKSISPLDKDHPFEQIVSLLYKQKKSKK